MTDRIVAVGFLILGFMIIWSAFAGTTGEFFAAILCPQQLVPTGGVTEPPPPDTSTG